MCSRLLASVEMHLMSCVAMCIVLLNSFAYLVGVSLQFTNPFARTWEIQQSNPLTSFSNLKRYLNLICDFSKYCLQFLIYLSIQQTLRLVMRALHWFCSSVFQVLNQTQCCGIVGSCVIASHHILLVMGCFNSYGMQPALMSIFALGYYSVLAVE